MVAREGDHALSASGAGAGHDDSRGDAAGDEEFRRFVVMGSGGINGKLPDAQEGRHQQRERSQREEVFASHGAEAYRVPIQ